MDIATDQKIVEAIARINLLSSAVAPQAQEATALVTQKAEQSQEQVKDHKAELSWHVAVGNIVCCSRESNCSADRVRRGDMAL